MIVMKFGGASNQDVPAMRNAVSIIQSHLYDRPVAVISAIARATNELEQTARLAVAGNLDAAVALATRLSERLHREFYAGRS